VLGRSPLRTRSVYHQQHTVTALVGSVSAATAEGMSSKKSELVAGLERGLRQRPVISKTDEAFAADGVEFVYGADGIDLAELNDLFKKARQPTLALCLT